MKKLFLLVSIAMLSCGEKSPETKPSLTSSAPIETRYQAAVSRAVYISDNGWIVSRDPAFNALDQGDSLLFTGIALHAMPCEAPSPLFGAFPDGKLYRHPLLPSDISLDGSLGFYFGLASRYFRCGQTEAVRAAFSPHFTFSEENNDRIGATDERLPSEFTYIRDLLGYRMGLRSEPDTNRRRFLEGLIVGWAQATMSSRSSCYRIHLGWLALKTLEFLDSGPTGTAKRAFCSATSGSDLPVVDNWCGRGNLIEWIDNFQADQWAYRHQRCPGWDTPDGNGNEQPGIDFLLGVREAYNIN